MKIWQLNCAGHGMTHSLDTKEKTEYSVTACQQKSVVESAYVNTYLMHFLFVSSDVHSTCGNTHMKVAQTWMLQVENSMGTKSLVLKQMYLV